MLGANSLRYVTAFISGFITLSLELLGFRLLAPYFGYSIYVFGSLIGLVLLALSAGYWLGGSLADKGVKESSFFKMVLLGGIYLALASTFYPQMLEAMAGLSVVTGALLGTFLLFAFPMVTFAALSPYLVASLAKGEGVGISAGKIFAIGTLGSLLGTFLTSFYLLPGFGTRATFFINVLLGILLPAFWLFRSKKWHGAAIVFAGIPLLIPAPPLSKNILASTESPYSHLEVVDYGEFLGLRTEERSASAYAFAPKKAGWDYGISRLYNLFAVPPLLNGAKNDLLLGFGTGMVAGLHREANPGLRLTGVEIDPKIIELGRQYFDLDNFGNVEKIAIADVRPYLRGETGYYDLIEVDIFKGGVEVPFYLATREFFAAVKARLAPGGILALNIYDPFRDQRIKKPLLNTIAGVYPYTYIVPAGNGSYLVLGSENQIVAKGLSVSDPDLEATINYFEANIERVAFDEKAQFFTDDLAPLEKLYAEE